jgi:hypothetical protein
MGSSVAAAVKLDDAVGQVPAGADLSCRAAAERAAHRRYVRQPGQPGQCAVDPRPASGRSNRSPGLKDHLCGVARLGWEVLPQERRSLLRLGVAAGQVGSEL